MENKYNKASLTIEQLAELAFPAFAVVSDEQSIHYGHTDSINSWIPTNIIELISSYLELYKPVDEDIENINLIINVNEYFSNPKAWIDRFTKALSEESKKITTPIEIDFEKEYMIIEYKKAEIVFLQGLNPEAFNQLLDLCRWIDCEKIRRRVINSFNSTPVKVKYLN